MLFYLCDSTFYLCSTFVFYLCDVSIYLSICYSQLFHNCFYLIFLAGSQRGSFTVIPVLVGSTNIQKEAMYGRIFSKYLMDPENLFVISSDFCHWGEYNVFRADAIK